MATGPATDRSSLRPAECVTTPVRNGSSPSRSTTFCGSIAGGSRGAVAGVDDRLAVHSRSRSRRRRKPRDCALRLRETSVGTDEPRHVDHGCDARRHELSSRPPPETASLSRFHPARHDSPLFRNHGTSPSPELANPPTIRASPSSISVRLHRLTATSFLHPIQDRLDHPFRKLRTRQNFGENPEYLSIHLSLQRPESSSSQHAPENCSV